MTDVRSGYKNKRAKWLKPRVLTCATLNPLWNRSECVLRFYFFIAPTVEFVILHRISKQREQSREKKKQKQISFSQCYSQFSCFSNSFDRNWLFALVFFLFPSFPSKRRRVTTATETNSVLCYLPILLSRLIWIFYHFSWGASCFSSGSYNFIATKQEKDYLTIQVKWKKKKKNIHKHDAYDFEFDRADSLLSIVLMQLR